MFLKYNKNGLEMKLNEGDFFSGGDGGFRFISG